MRTKSIRLKFKKSIVVILAGLVGVSVAWGPQVGFFADEILTVVPDYEGAPGSTVSEKSYSLGEYALGRETLSESLTPPAAEQT